MLKTIVVFTLLVSLLYGCSTRQVYETRLQISQPALDAININTATAEELEKLPHIGRKTAEAIVQFRTDNGPFRRPEYLMLIRGISEKRFAEMRTFLKTE